MLCVFLGATYLSLKTTVRSTTGCRLSGRIGWVAAILIWVFVTWGHLGLGRGFVPNPLDASAVMAAVAAAWLAESRQEGWAFTAASLAIASAVGSIFFDLFSHVMVSTASTAYNLTVANTASPSYTLKVMTVVAVVFLPGCPHLPGLDLLRIPESTRRSDGNRR